MNAVNLGIARQQAHPNGTKRYYSDENREDIIGLSGEIAFGKKYNLNPDLKIRPNGDNHIDFKIKINDDKIITLDVKTAQKAYNLLIKEWEIDKCSDILILAQFHNEEDIEFLGWSTKKEMKNQSKKIFSSLNINNYYLHKNKLKPMDLLDYLFNNNKIQQIEEL